MFIIKNKYYIYIDNLSSINLNKIKQGWKFCLIYRNYRDKIDIEKLKIFAKKCKKKNIKFFVSNNLFLALKIKADGVYLPSFNKNYIRIHSASLKNFQIICSLPFPFHQVWRRPLPVPSVFEDRSGIHLPFPSVFGC